MEKKKNIKMLVLAFFLFSCGNNVFGKNIDFDDVSMTQLKKNSFIKENLKTIIAGTAGVIGTSLTYIIQTKEIEKIQKTANNAADDAKKTIDEQSADISEKEIQINSITSKLTDKERETKTLKDELIESQSKHQEEGVLLIKDKNNKEHKISFENDIKDILLIENNKSPKKKISKADLNITSGPNIFNINSASDIEIQTEIIRRGRDNATKTSIINIIANIANNQADLFVSAIDKIATSDVNKIMNNSKINSQITQKETAAKTAALDNAAGKIIAALKKAEGGDEPVAADEIDEDNIGSKYSEVLDELKKIAALQAVAEKKAALDNAADKFIAVLQKVKRGEELVESDDEIDADNIGSKYNEVLNALKELKKIAVLDGPKATKEALDNAVPIIITALEKVKTGKTGEKVDSNYDQISKNNFGNKSQSLLKKLNEVKDQIEKLTNDKTNIKETAVEETATVFLTALAKIKDGNQVDSSAIEKGTVGSAHADVLTNLNEIASKIVTLSEEKTTAIEDKDAALLQATNAARDKVTADDALLQANTEKDQAVEAKNVADAEIKTVKDAKTIADAEIQALTVEKTTALNEAQDARDKLVLANNKLKDANTEKENAVKEAIEQTGEIIYTALERATTENELTEAEKKEFVDGSDNIKEETVGSKCTDLLRNLNKINEKFVIAADPTDSDAHSDA